MNIDEIFDEWQKDSHIAETDLAHESLKLPKLHGKWYRYLSKERLINKKLNEDYNELFLLKHRYYSGNLDEETLKENNWEQNPLRILKGDLAMHISADKEIINLKLRIELQKEKVEILDSIVKNIMNRSFHIKNAIDFIKFQNADF